MMKPATTRVVIGLRVLLVVWTVCGEVAISAGQEAPRFLTVAPGISHATFDVRPPDGEPFSGHAFRIDLGEAELRLVPANGPSPRQTVEQIASPFPAVVAVNASFFDNFQMVGNDVLCNRTDQLALTFKCFNNACHLLASGGNPEIIKHESPHASLARINAFG